MMDLRNKLFELLDQHRNEAKITCPENCICWDIEAILNKEQTCTNYKRKLSDWRE
ncbi:MAG: hypothetical protein M0R51_12640 [Clostridia bacterium]|jgi:hypothetical protein|nr:hypothetical protein [Clostridia bacterium]